MFFIDKLSGRVIVGKAAVDLPCPNIHEAFQHHIEW
uniref:Uncharacterized protein n=1 Tax=Arundo donax TaxID=35708 RepID=A0A0A9BXL6_ARUDO